MTSSSPSGTSTSSPAWRGSTCSCDGLRTATAQVETPRIITPSSTAWPPTGASRCALIRPSASSCCCGSVTAWMLNAAQSVHVVLLARLCDQLFRIDHDAHLLLAHGAVERHGLLLPRLERVDDLRLVHDLAVDAQQRADVLGEPI